MSISQVAICDSCQTDYDTFGGWITHRPSVACPSLGDGNVHHCESCASLCELAAKTLIEAGITEYVPEGN